MEHRFHCWACNQLYIYTAATNQAALLMAQRAGWRTVWAWRKGKRVERHAVCAKCAPREGGEE